MSFAAKAGRVTKCGGAFRGQQITLRRKPLRGTASGKTRNWKGLGRGPSNVLLAHQRGHRDSTDFRVINLFWSVTICACYSLRS